MSEARSIDVPVEGGTLRVAVTGEGPPVLLVHGITANHLMWTPVVARLSDDHQLIVPDLRGRGDSAALPGPFGMAAHVRDAIATFDHLGIDTATVVGGSMGGYVAVLLAAQHPDRVASVGLCDGGVALPVPDGVDPEQMLAATLGPSLERLDMTFADVDDYLAFWKQHPAFVDGWSDVLDAFVRYDVAPADGGRIRSKVNKDAIVADGRDLLTNTDVHRCIADITCPVWLLRAPRGLLDQPQPLIPDEVLALWRGDRLPQLDDEMLEDVNHWTLFLGDRGADAIARRIRASVLALA
jgi:pimeloyl-ACP methyl ester carboxylesterase